MALVVTGEYIQGNEVAQGTVSWTGNYGTPEDDRDDRGNFMLLSSNDKAGTRTYIGVSNTTPLVTDDYAITTTEDGWHQATLISAKKWLLSESYVADNVVYYVPTNKWYNCIQANTNVAPDSGGGDDYWEEVTDMTTIQTGHTNMDVFNLDFMVESRTDLAIANELYDVLAEDFMCKLNIADAAHPLNLIAMIEAAQSKMLDDQPDQADQIIDAIITCTS